MAAPTALLTTRPFMPTDSRALEMARRSSSTLWRRKVDAAVPKASVGQVESQFRVRHAGGLLTMMTTARVAADMAAATRAAMVDMIGFRS